MSQRLLGWITCNFSRVWGKLSPKGAQVVIVWIPWKILSYTTKNGKWVNRRFGYFLVGWCNSNIFPTHSPDFHHINLACGKSRSTSIGAFPCHPPLISQTSISFPHITFFIINQFQLNTIPSQFRILKTLYSYQYLLLFTKELEFIVGLFLNIKDTLSEHFSNSCGLLL